MTTFSERYPEMGMEGADSGLEQLLRDLDRMGKASRVSTVPEQTDVRIARALEERAMGGQGKEPAVSHSRSILRRHRVLAFAAAVAAAVLMVMGGTYAAAPVLTRVFDLGGASDVIQRNLGTEVNLSQRLAGYTMTVRRVYADPNRILIAYSIRPPVTGHRLWNMSTNLNLTDAQGDVLPERSLVADGGGTEPETTLQGFDAAAIEGDPRTLHLRLTVPWIEAMEQLHMPPASGQGSAQEFPGLPSTGAFGSVAIARPVGERDPWMEIVRTYGPISFDVTVPVERAREVYPHQKVEAGGVTAALERVVISPAETRLYVSGLEPNTFGTLSVSGSEVEDAPATQWRWHGMTVFSFFGDLLDRHGEWTFVVKRMPPLPLPSGVTPPPGSTPARGGPWTFHLTVP